MAVKAHVFGEMNYPVGRAVITGQDPPHVHDAKTIAIVVEGSDSAKPGVCIANIQLDREATGEAWSTGPGSLGSVCDYVHSDDALNTIKWIDAV